MPKATVIQYNYNRYKLTHAPLLRDHSPTDYIHCACVCFSLDQSYLQCKSSGCHVCKSFHLLILAKGQSSLQF